MNRYLRDYLILVLPAAVIVGLDQWTKWLVRTYLPFDGMWLPTWLSWLSPYARIVYWYNSGAAFGSFQNGNPVFTVLAIIVIVLIFYYFPRIDSSDWTLRVALVLQLAGASGNLVDRLLMGKVTDFISSWNISCLQCCRLIHFDWRRRSVAWGLVEGACGQKSRAPEN